MIPAALEKIHRANLRKEPLPEICIGDSISVHALIREGEKERVQVFAGTVIARKGGGASETITVRRISYGIGVEKVFPLNSPHVVKVDVTAQAGVRRAKLYYLRGRSGKKSRLRTRRA